MKLFARIEKRTPKSISGWLLDLDDDNKSLSMIINSNGSRTHEIICDLACKKLSNTKFHKTGNCGFKIDLTEFDSLTETIVVLNLIEKESNIEINISPIIIDRRKFNNRVLLVGFNKSGTSILSQRIAAGMSTSKLFFEPQGKLGLSKYESHVPFTSQNNIVTKCLFYPEFATNITQISNLYDKKVWIIRDPRDVLLSIFFYKWKSKSANLKLVFNEILKMVQKKESKPSEISFLAIAENVIDLNHILSVYKRMDRYLKTIDTSWFIVKYEEHINQNNKILNSYLGFPVEESAEMEDKTAIKRSSSFGAWRDWFTKEDVTHLMPLLNPILSQFHYNESDWGLNNPDFLDPGQGSEYMKLIFMD